MGAITKTTTQLILALGLGCIPASAQFLITPESDPHQLLNNLYGSGISLVGTPVAIGGANSSGVFSGGLSAGLDFDAGLIFSTGNVLDAIGPNDHASKSTNFGLAGDIDLAAITGLSSQDASGLQFSFTTSTGDLFFNFLFASEEYEEYINSSVNDVFAFFLTPDIESNTPGNQPGVTRNLALIQGTNDPITVDTVTPTTNSSSYISNKTGTENHQFDGRTKNIIASAEGIGPGEHIIKIVIGDSGDSVLDSAVFLQAGTFGGQPGLVTNGLPVIATLRQTQLSMAQVGLRDVNSRLFRLRNRRPHLAPIVPSSDKGSYSSKGGGKEIIPMPLEQKRWEAFGSLHTYSENVDGSATLLPGTRLSIITLPDYEIDVFGGAAGIEYRYNNEWSLGAAVIANHSKVDMGTLGDIDSDGYALAFYASYYKQNFLNGPGDWYADFLYGYGTNDNDIARRSIAGSATSNTESNDHIFAINTGYSLRNKSWIHGPFGSLTLTKGKLDGFTEAGVGAASFPTMDHESLLGRLGYRVAKVIPLSRGTLIPQIHTAWEHEFENDSITIGGFPLSAPAEDRLVSGLGVSWEFSENGRAFLNYENRIGSDIESHQINLRFGFKF